MYFTYSKILLTVKYIYIFISSRVCDYILSLLKQERKYLFKLFANATILIFTFLWDKIIEIFKWKSKKITDYFFFIFMITFILNETEYICIILLNKLKYKKTLKLIISNNKNNLNKQSQNIQTEISSPCRSIKFILILTPDKS